MTIGYLLNTYPATSSTFIRREIEALERRGVEVARFAVRRWDEELVDPRDRSEAERTEYLLSGNKAALLKATAREKLSNFGGWLKACRAALTLARAQGDIVRPLAYLAEAALFKQRAAAKGISHVHTHFATNATAVAMLSRIMGGPSYSFTAHGPDEFDNARLFAFDLKLQHAAFAIAITHFARMQLIRWGGHQHRDKIHVARCGLELSEFLPSPPPPESTRLVCVGRLCPQKGQTLIPEAIAPLVRDFPELEVVLIGDGESRSEIESEVARLGLEKHLTLKGWMANKQVLEEVRQARALLLPSFAEGLPIVIMEAMALGRPVISTYIAGIPELLDEDCGAIIPPSSTEDLRAAIRRIMATGPGKLAALGREGRRRIEERHDIDKLAAALEGHFAEAVGAPVGSGKVAPPLRSDAA
jgi:glycosyltransferase involved in cell wall biosynthesis